MTLVWSGLLTLLLAVHWTWSGLILPVSLHCMSSYLLSAPICRWWVRSGPYSIRHAGSGPSISDCWIGSICPRCSDHRHGIFFCANIIAYLDFVLHLTHQRTMIIMGVTASHAISTRYLERPNLDGCHLTWPHRATHNFNFPTFRQIESWLIDFPTWLFSTTSNTLGCFVVHPCGQRQRWNRWWLFHPDNAAGTNPDPIETDTACPGFVECAVTESYEGTAGAGRAR